MSQIMRSGIRIALIAALPLIALPSAGATAAGTRARSQVQLLSGSWTLTANVPGEPLIHALITFDSGGGFVETAAAPGVSTGHGVWVRTGKRVFSLTNVYLRLDSAGRFIGTSRVQATFRVNRAGSAGNGRFQTRVFDPSGRQVNSFGGTAHAERIRR